jgi:signal transduction histidine kinase
MQEVSDNIYLLIIIGMFGSALLVISFILINIRNRNKLLRQKRNAQEAVLQHQKDLLHATINSQEEERKRIGSDLHDEVGSALSTLRMYIQKFTHEPEAGITSEFGIKSRSMIDSIITNTRNISHDLSPITGGAYGLSDALEDFCDQVNEAGRLEITLSIANENILNQLDLTHALALYRVIRELIKNTVTHAEAKHITIDFRDNDGHLYLIYKDDGKGMEKTTGQKGMGMNNIESRLGMIGASYEIRTGPGRGFEIAIRVPIKMK